MALYARALRDLGAWLGERSGLEAVGASGDTAAGLARALAAGMPLFDDPGFFKRAQIAVNDLVVPSVSSLSHASRTLPV